MAEQLMSTAVHDKLPRSYVRPETDCPRLDEVVADAHIPVVDLSNPDRAAVVSQIGAACTSHGFFQVINHGLPVEELMREVMEAVHEFFHLSPEVEAKLYSDDPAKNTRLSTSFNMRNETLHNYFRPFTAGLLPAQAVRPGLAIQSTSLQYVMESSSYRPYLTGNLRCELEAIIREGVLGIQQYDGRYGSNTGSIYGDANKLEILLNYHMLMAEISGNSNYLRLVAEAQRRLGQRCPYEAAGRLCYNAEAAGGLGSAAVVVPASGVLRGEPAMQDIYRAARIVALEGHRGSSFAGELYNHGQPRGLLRYQADRVADGGGGGFVAIDVDDEGHPEHHRAQPPKTADDRGELVERVLQSMFCGVVPACATSHTLFKDGPDYVRFTIFSGLLFIAAVTYTGMFCRSRGKAALRVAACATVALITFAVASQLSATDHVVVAAAMGMVTCLIMSTGI